MNQPSVSFTANAVSKVHELILEEGNPQLKLRVSITGGGCSGFQYAFSFEEDVQEDDIIIVKSAANEDFIDGDEEGGDEGESGGQVTFLIDPMSLQYLMGATIDYQTDISGEQFVINNPNAQTTCGCGSSFSV